MPHRTVIVGAGIAGVSAAAAMRRSGYEGEIDLLGAEPELPYRRPPVSKEIVRGEKTARRDPHQEARVVRAAVGQPAHRRHGRPRSTPTAHVVHLADGEEVAYDQLLLATGGRARNPWSAAGIRTLRSLADAPDLQAELAPGHHLIVVGAGLIGSEIAASARTMGCDVTLLETAALPLPRLLPPELGELYVDLHKSEGTDLHTGVEVSSIDDEDGQTVVRASDGRTWSAPVVVVAVGMQPNVELAEAAGIEVANGIVVDALGRTSAPDVFAAGDVANQPNGVLGGRHRVEHWQGSQNHGTAIGKVMAGGEDPFVEVPWCWSDQYGHNLQVTGWPETSHELVVHGSLADRDFIAYLLDDGVVRGAVGIGRPRDIRAAEKWIAAGQRLDEALEAGA